MNQLSETVKKKRVSPWLIGCGGLGIVIAGLVTWGVLQVVDYPLVAPRIDTVVKDYKATGLPWVASEVAAPIPDKQNAAIEIKKAIALAEGGSFAKSDKELTERWAARDKSGIAKSLRELKPAMDKFTVASKKPSLNFDRDWNKGADILFPEFAEIKNVSKILTKRAVFRAESGDLTGAISDLETINRLSDLITQDPTLIAMLVGIAINMIGQDGALRVAQVRSDSASLRRLIKSVEGYFDNFEMSRSMRGEAIMGIALLRNMKPGDVKKLANMEDGPGIQYKRVDGVPDGMIMKAYFVRHLEAQIKVHETLQKYPDDILSACRELDEYEAKMAEGVVPKLSQIMNAVLFPIFGQAGEAVERVRTRKQITLAIIKSLEFRNAKGRFPKSLDEVGMNYIDRVSQQPIVSLNAGGVFTVYSFGKNGVDDGGIKDNDTGQDDYAVRYPPKSW